LVPPALSVRSQREDHQRSPAEVATGGTIVTTSQRHIARNDDSQRSIWSACRCFPNLNGYVGIKVNHSHVVVSSMSGEVRTDERGRVTIPKEVRDRYGEKFRLVELDSGIKLVPIPEDPLKELRAAASDELREAALADLEEAAREAARDQAGENVR
jgi:bifunctional DNA-binding transcriptional regulator/antitoxin component of YhaV-PrlF toxin-antitoxin module